MYPDFDYTWINYRTMFEMLQKAINKAGSVDPLKIALALEGMEITDAAGQKNTMRRDRPPVDRSVLCRGVHQGREIRFRADRVRLEDRDDDSGVRRWRNRRRAR